ncbi:Eukaryotic peptide chain release factor subunit 1 [Phytophthora cactorum]|uniref:peptidylprolyl isomerase n=1 Tax=Phytophthora cactorum TaxID=29920 RepID=A0A8T1FJ61_9STRA|nr:Eukaryotic peptide chain release factor subunit 1 [Phytophthora cactorum]KAG2972858.1 Eukaryotic peptide chain release factor subunit 1 [Phytophthora cactorum]KAG3016716.1 Eukaryotic peptide chain release factor subunit 1 [Phytophthora cactorum]KAG3073805.1 Eukaryotic peptide chain release factor subunit 1 [Phytophthora cactorum]KAG3148616.1 Eukaryotic peptide chain release factor subunit 1 [Phytophthora cactorum]
MSTPNAADDQVELFKVKKLIKSLQAARGNGTSMISLIIPPKQQIPLVAKMLSDEMGTASNIKSRVNRLSVLGAITSTQQRLKLYNKCPPNGLIIYCGTIITDEGKEKRVNIDFEPFRPINTSLYMCDNKFHTEALGELMQDQDRFGFIIMDGNGALYGTVSGSNREILHKFSVDLPKKHGRGGQSALRFARLRLEKRHNYVRKVAETATQMFITNDQPNISNLVLAGSADFKNELNGSDLFDKRLAAIVVKVVDVSYGGENGFNQAIELAAETLANVKFVQEKKLIVSYMEEIAQDSGKYCFGVGDTMKALDLGAVETLILWEDLPHHRYVLRNEATGAESFKILSPSEESVDSNFMDAETGAKLETVERTPLVEWFANNYKQFGTTLEFVTARSQEGSQFCQGFGGIGGILRWKVDFMEMDYDETKKRHAPWRGGKELAHNLTKDCISDISRPPAAIDFRAGRRQYSGCTGTSCKYPAKLHSKRRAVMGEEASETLVERMEGNVEEEKREQQAAACLQRMFRCRKARLRLRQMLASVFEKFYDADSGLYYYLDKRTGETTWEKPRALRGDDDIELTAVYDGKVEQASEAAESTGEESTQQVADLDKNDSKSGKEVEEKYLGYSSQDVALVQEQFAHYDTDSSGSINASELHKLFINLGEQLTLNNVRELIKAVDSDGNGEVDFDEFLHLLRKQQDKNQYSASLTLALLFGPKELTKLKQQFMILDLDGSGAIDEHELQQLVKKLGHRAEEFDLPAMLREVDVDGSGSIGFNEFLQIVASMTKSDGSGPKSAFAALLDMGIAQGLLNGLDEVVQASRQKVYEWLNSDLVAEQKRLQGKRERRRRQEEERQRQLAKDQELFAKHQAQLAAIERARHAQIEGLAIEVEFEGDGRNFPLAGQFARVHYVASFERNEEIFESTRARCGSALEFCVGAGHTIQGFDLALQRMSVGETARVTIAPALAYGVKGRPPRIPPNAALVFRIELISIKEKLQSSIEMAPITPVQRVRNR